MGGGGYKDAVFGHRVGFAAIFSRIRGDFSLPRCCPGAEPCPAAVTVRGRLTGAAAAQPEALSKLKEPVESKSRTA